MQWPHPQSAAWCWLLCLASLLIDDPRGHKISIAPVSSCEQFSTFELFFSKISFHLYDFIIVVQHGPCRLWISTSSMMPRHGSEHLRHLPFQASHRAAHSCDVRCEWPQRRAPWAAFLRRTLFCPTLQEGLGWSLCGPSFWGRWNCV